MYLGKEDSISPCSPKKVYIRCCLCPPFLKNHLRSKVMHYLARGRPHRSSGGTLFCALWEVKQEGRGAGLIKGHSHWAMLLPNWLAAPQVSACCHRMCLGFKDRNRPLWGSYSLGSPGLTSTMAAHSWMHRLYERPVPSLALGWYLGSGHAWWKWVGGYEDGFLTPRSEVASEAR